ncbi:helix-turn-helix domain-containing protein [Sorangium sp. So ce131]|uniref:helix-turn-helix domain-containing protein n=1 Tax=Sorangium sp. So ce131 TaxID=3133282 RepID=UPI003F5F4BB1
MKTQYTLLSGETVEFPTPTGELDVFLRRVLLAATDPAVSEAELNDLVLGPENPLLDKTAVVGRSVATADVYRDPLFHVMLDCIARKRLPAQPAVAAPRTRYTMTVPEAAQQLGISESAVRQAIYASRLRASKEGGTYYLDPHSVASYRVSKRGPRRQDQQAKGRPGATLDARIGSGPDASFRVKHSRDEFELTERRGPEWTGMIPSGWRRIAILGTSKELARYWEIEPAEGESVLHFEGFYVRGGFRVVETVSTTQRAVAAFKAFQPR